MRNLIRGIASLLLLAVLLVGIPVGLVLLAGNPLPSAEELQRVFTSPDFGGTFLIGSLLPMVAWLAWATFAIGFLVELPAQIRRIEAPRIPGLRLQQRGAGVLIAAVIVMIVGGSVVGGAAPAAIAADLSLAPANPVSLSKVVGQAPIAEPEVIAPAPTETQRVVVSGDTLWDIAAEELGDGNRYPEIYAATAGQQQPGGGELTDPNLILPGWVVDVPVAPEVAAAAAPQPVSQVVPAPVEEVVAAAPIAEVALASAASGVDAGVGEGTERLEGMGISTTAETAQAAPAAAPAVEDYEALDYTEESWDESSFLAGFTAGGIGGFLAAGLLSVLGIRRLRQRRNRKPGQRIAMPDETISPIELELRSVETPMAMDDVDRALRYLAAWAQGSSAVLPPIYAVRLADDEISLYIDEPARLPAPFVAVSDDLMAWTIDPSQLPELEQLPSPPYPALVTLGHDARGGHILVDLEHIGALNLAGSPEATTASLRALALELATSQWAEDLRITLVGVAPGLPAALGTGRVRHIDDVDALLVDLRGQADDVERALAELGVGSIEEARSIGPAADAWVPEIVILGQLPGVDSQRELAELVTRIPRVGVASIAAGQLVGDWTLEVGDDHTAVLRPLGLELSPQLVNESEYSKVLELLRATEADAVAAAAAVSPEVTLEELEPVVDGGELRSRLSAVPPLEYDTSWKDEIAALLPPVQYPMATPGRHAAPLVDEVPEAAEPEISEPVTASVEEPTTEISGPEAPNEAPTAIIAPIHSTPMIRLLGKVELFGARGEEPRTPHTSEVNRSAVARATELIAFLTLNPGANHLELHAAFWPTQPADGQKASTNRNQLTHKARKWLGSADDGTPYFPRVGRGGYRLHEGVTSDWDQWQALVGSDAGAASTANLIAALKLVEAPPISGVKDRYYVWAERVRQEMIAAISDAAHELATRSLRAGDVVNARLAAAVGRMVDPINETLWRDAMLAEHQAGDLKGFDRVVTQLEDYLESFGEGYEAEPETQELVEKVRLAAS